MAQIVCTGLFIISNLVAGASALANEHSPGVDMESIELVDSKSDKRINTLIKGQVASLKIKLAAQPNQPKQAKFKLDPKALTVKTKNKTSTVPTANKDVDVTQIDKQKYLIEWKPNKNEQVISLTLPIKAVAATTLTNLKVQLDNQEPISLPIQVREHYTKNAQPTFDKTLPFKDIAEINQQKSKLLGRKDTRKNSMSSTSNAGKVTRDTETQSVNSATRSMIPSRQTAGGDFSATPPSAKADSDSGDPQRKKQLNAGFEKLKEMSTERDLLVSWNSHYKEVNHRIKVNLKFTSGWDYYQTNFDGSISEKKRAEFDRDGLVIKNVQPGQAFLILNPSVGTRFEIQYTLDDSPSPYEYGTTHWQINNGDWHFQPSSKLSEGNVNITSEFFWSKFASSIYGSDGQANHLRFENSDDGRRTFFLVNHLKANDAIKHQPVKYDLYHEIEEGVPYNGLKQVYTGKFKGITDPLDVLYEIYGQKVTGYKNVYFKDGKAQITLADNEFARVLGYGSSSLKATISDDQVIQLKNPSYQAIYMGNSSGIQIEEGPGNTATAYIGIKGAGYLGFTNEYDPSGDGVLTLHKQVESQDNQDLEKTFKFKISPENRYLQDFVNLELPAELKLADGKTEQKTVKFDETGVATVELKHGESLKIKQVPNDRYLTIKEIETNDLNASWSAKEDGTYLPQDELDPTVTVGEGGKAELYFKNSSEQIPKKQSMISKRASAAVSSEQEFDFVIKRLSTDKEKVTYQIFDLLTGEATSESLPLDFDSDQAKITLKKNQAAVIFGLAQGDYQVFEVDPQINGLKTTYSDKNSEDKAHDYQATPTNQYVSNESGFFISFFNDVPQPPEGELIINKEITGNYDGEQATQEFDFLIEKLTDNGDVDLDFNAEVAGMKNNEKVTIKFTKGVAKIKLAPFETIRLRGLKPDDHFRVSEAAKAGYKVSNRVNSSQLNQTTTAYAKTNDQITFYNRVIEVPKKDESIITKYAGNNVRPQKFVFMLQWVDTNTIPKESYEYRVENIHTNTEVGKGKLKFDNNGQATIDLHGNERALITGLPKGKYNIYEVKPVDAGLLTKYLDKQGKWVQHHYQQSPIEDQVDEHGFKASFYNYIKDKDPEKPSVPHPGTEDNYFTVRKRVGGNQANKDQAFKFTVKLKDINQKLITGTISTIEKGEVTFNDQGKYTFKLKHQEQLTFIVPKGATYTVSEDNYHADGYQTLITQTDKKSLGLKASGIANGNVIDYLNWADKDIKIDQDNLKDPTNNLSNDTNGQPTNGNSHPGFNDGGKASGKLPISGKSYGPASGTGDNLPQTGEDSQVKLLMTGVLGLIMALIGGVTYYIKFKKR